MRALVYLDPDTGVSIEWDISVGSYHVMTPDALPIKTFVRGNAQTVGQARKHARRWIRDEYPKIRKEAP